MISCNFENSDLGSHDIKILTLLHSKKTNSQHLIVCEKLSFGIGSFSIIIGERCYKNMECKDIIAISTSVVKIARLERFGS